MSTALFEIPVVIPDLRTFDLIVVNSSAGKDSMAMLAYVAEQAKQAGVSARLVVIHNDLGTTDTGEPVEWPGVEALAREHAQQYGIRFETTRRDKGGLWDQLLNERHLWPSSSARWCTSDQKTSQGVKVVTRLVRDWRRARGLRPAAGRPVEVLYCLGIRAQESRDRAKKLALEVDEAHSSPRRTITRWLPIHGWTVKQVWDQIKAAGLRPHTAYAQGMKRLSCSLCVLASPSDLVTAARLRPALAADYLRAEKQLGHRFRNDLSMQDIVTLAGA
ncbi:phosphoadenosine phosphosulfate reductase family protein [Acrocarpospora sp. B8E8]|uniref:phosphoadenosine phosphosulfate reductase family protein n=1 Tax=Acrocarpospora sp. B8E8 TaxID=3153572 RepID=UPI00325E97E7